MFLKEKPFKIPYTSTTDVKEVTFRPSAAMTAPTPFSLQEKLSHAKMNRTRNKRKSMKRVHKHAKKMNKLYRVRS